jgi:hypothetical protein
MGSKKFRNAVPPEENPFRKEYLQTKKNVSTGELPVSEYPRAWAEYNRRWVFMWLGFLALAAYFVWVMIVVKSHFPNLSKSERKLLWGVLFVPGLIVCMIPYFRFDAWPCPRCGISFSDWRNKWPLRPERCHACGLRRGALTNEPELHTVPVQGLKPKLVKRADVPKCKPADNTGIPTDATLIFFLLIAYVLIPLGWSAIGGIIAFGSLVYYMICLGREKRPFLLHYPYYHSSYRNVIFLGLGLLFLGGIHLSRAIPSPIIPIIALTCLGAMFYYSACVNLYTRIATGRYGSQIRRSDRPALYWFATAILGLCGLLLILLPFFVYTLGKNNPR